MKIIKNWIKKIKEKKRKKEIDECLKKLFEEYGETLKKLGEFRKV